jgi:uncharacterized protein
MPVVALLLAGPAFAQRPTESPSFDCSRAGNATERAICGNADLARRDRIIAERFAALRQSLDEGGRASLLTAQRDWLRHRNACGAEMACIRARMVQRNLDLARLAEAPRPAAQAAPAQAAPAQAAPAQAAPAQSAPATPAAGLDLFLPEAQQRAFHMTPGYFHSDRQVPLDAQTVLDLTMLNRRVRNQDHGHAWYGFLMEALPYVTPLFGQDERDPNAIGTVWTSELYESAQRRDFSALFPAAISAAILSSPRVLRCAYDRTRGTGAKPDLQAGGFTAWITISLHFWADPVPAALAPRALADFRGSRTGLHPFIVIGPQVAACPQTLAAAAELIASNFPQRVPLSRPPSVVQAGGATEADALMARLLGFTIAEVPAAAQTSRHVAVDRIAIDSPAFGAGVRSGDVISAVGWTRVNSAGAFRHEVLRRREQGAIVINLWTFASPSLYGGTLVRFATATPGPMQRVPRDATGSAPRGWTVVMRNATGTEEIAVRGADWCRPTVQAQVRQTLLFADSPAAPGHWQEGARRLKAQCPVLRQVRFVIYSVPHDAAVNVLVAEFDGAQVSGRREGLDGLPPGANVIETREIAARSAPICDRLAAHPGDPDRRYGLEGVAFIPDANVRPAVEACQAAVQRAPDDPVAMFQLGRALRRAGLHAQALGPIEIAAAEGHAAALQQLGEMYRAGEGVPVDPARADSLQQQALAAGYMPATARRSAVLDTTGASLPDVITSIHHGQRGVTDPFEMRRYAPFLHGMLQTINASCPDIVSPGFLPARLTRLRAAIVAMGIRSTDVDASGSARWLLARQDCQSAAMAHFVLMASELYAQD